MTEVPASEVLEDRTGSDANPALLCYVRRGRDLVDTLYREVMEQQGEVGMSGGDAAVGLGGDDKADEVGQEKHEVAETTTGEDEKMDKDVDVGAGVDDSKMEE